MYTFIILLLIFNMSTYSYLKSFEELWKRMPYSGQSVARVILGCIDKGQEERIKLQDQVKDIYKLVGQIKKLDNKDNENAKGNMSKKLESKQDFCSYRYPDYKATMQHYNWNSTTAGMMECNFWKGRQERRQLQEEVKELRKLVSQITKKLKNKNNESVSNNIPVNKYKMLIKKIAKKVNSEDLNEVVENFNNLLKKESDDYNELIEKHNVLKNNLDCALKKYSGLDKKYNELDKKYTDLQNKYDGLSNETKKNKKNDNKQSSYNKKNNNRQSRYNISVDHGTFLFLDNNNDLKDKYIEALDNGEKLDIIF